MTQYKRYAIYYLPDDPDFAALGAQWLGWDCIQGGNVRMDLDNEIVNKPAKYGFHATLKAPFRFDKDAKVSDLREAAREFAKRQDPVSIAGLELTRLGRFFALTPIGDVSYLNQLAERCVRELDQFRAPLTPEEIAKKSSDRLSPTQLEYLTNWGYPRIFEHFQFHITLTDKLPKPMQIEVQKRAHNHFQNWLDRPFDLQSICLVGEDSNGCFHLIERYQFEP